MNLCGQTMTASALIMRSAVSLLVGDTKYRIPVVRYQLLSKIIPYCRHARQAQCSLLLAPGLQCRLSSQDQCTAKRAENTTGILLSVQLFWQANVLASIARMICRVADESGVSLPKTQNLRVTATLCLSLMCLYPGRRHKPADWLSLGISSVLQGP